MIFFLCVLMLSFLTAVCRAESQSDASSAIASAEQRVVVCYNAAASAAKAGANVTVLLSSLTVAGNLLSNATLAFANGDYVSAEALAVQSQQDLVGFDAEANGLRTTALHAGFVNFEVNIVGSLVAAAVVVACAFVVWLPLKKKYRL